MHRSTCLFSTALLVVAVLHAAELQRVNYNNPGLVVDLGVGLWAWPLPMDYDGDGDLDLVVSGGGKPYEGTYFFENPSPPASNTRMPVFKPGVRITGYHSNVQASYVQGRVRITTPGFEYPEFLTKGFDERVNLPLGADDVHRGSGRTRANQWKYSDYNGDGTLDLIVGIGDWTDYGWDDAYNEQGEWTNGPLHGFVYIVLNEGTNAEPRYSEPVKLTAGGAPVDVYGKPSPNFADFDGDGDLDLICGEFLDKFTYFENTGARTSPRYAGGRLLRHNGQTIRMDLEMIAPVAVDWDGDGDIDLIVGDEDGRVALVENTGRLVDGMPDFLPPGYFQQEAGAVKFGALVTPVSFDWDGDGDEDLICGNTAGYIGFIENLDGADPPKWAAPVCLRAAGDVIRIQAGENGSIQGPCEAKWGYTTLSVADWDGDLLPDVVLNSIWGKVVWFRNTGTRESPQLQPAQPVRVAWPGEPRKPSWTWWNPSATELATQWRTTPAVLDLNRDGLNDLAMLDHEGYLALFKRVRRDGELILQAGERLFLSEGASVFGGRHEPRNTASGPLRLNAGRAGKSGRRKFCFTDWDGDGRLDLLVNSVNVSFLKNLTDGDGPIRFRDMGNVASQVLAGHTTSPTTVDWDGNGVPDLLIGAEDGFLYHLKNPTAPGRVSRQD